MGRVALVVLDLLGYRQDVVSVLSLKIQNHQIYKNLHLHYFSGESS